MVIGAEGDIAINVHRKYMDIGVQRKIAIN